MHADFRQSCLPVGHRALRHVRRGAHGEVDGLARPRRLLQEVSELIECWRSPPGHQRIGVEVVVELLAALLQNALLLLITV